MFDPKFCLILNSIVQKFFAFNIPKEEAVVSMLAYYTLWLLNVMLSKMERLETAYSVDT